MKDKNFPHDINTSSLKQLTDEANRLIVSLENEKDLNNSVQTYQQLLKLNNIIEKKFQKSFKSINEHTNKKIREIRNKNEKKA
tara:strand:+ start:271 stop:519 length:249 start_codon:yes stop_codon:yes gene_type:complete